MSKEEMNKREDYIMVWRCLDCRRYYINFPANKIYCELCGKKMERYTYKKLESKKEQKK